MKHKEIENKNISEKLTWDAPKLIQLDKSKTESSGYYRGTESQAYSYS